MSAIPELPQPGVKVIQEYTAAAPTITVPALVPCVVGACYEIHELYDSNDNLNSDILVSGPAIATAEKDESQYTSMTSGTLKLRISGGVEQTFTMPATATLTAQQVASAINGATPAPVGFQAYVYEDSGGDKYLQLRTSGTGQSQTIQITGGTLAGATNQFGFGIGYTYYGLGSYIQDKVYLKQSSFPDPRGNLDELDIIEDTIRVFFDLSTTVTELLQTESFLRRGVGTGVAAAYDDGDGDQTTPFVDLETTPATADNLLALPIAAQVNSGGTVDFTADVVDVHTKTVIIQVDGGGPQTVTLVGDPVVSTLSTGWTFPQTTTLTVSVNGSSQTVAITTAADLDAVITQINTAAQTNWSVDIAFKADQYGNASGAGTYLGLIYGADPTAAAAESVQNVVIVTNDTTDEIFNGASTTNYVQNLQANSNGPRDPAWTQINNVLGATVASLATTLLRLESSAAGQESKIELSSNSTALSDLDLTAGSTYGNPFVARVGDYLYSDGTYRGMIIEVHPGGQTGRVRLDQEVALTLSSASWYIVAKNLDTVASSQWGVSVPTPDLSLDSNNDVWIKHDFLRDTTGAPVDNTAVSIYVMYNALRLDVTSQASESALLAFDNVDDLEDALGPVTQDNPLAYGLFVTMSNAPGQQIYGIGVHEVSADRPYGTIVGFSSAFSFLESREVYAIAIMTSDADVASLLNTHVDAMSEPDQKKERIGIFHLGTPERKVDTIAVSGNDGDTSAAAQFDTKIATLSQALLALGVDPASIDISDGVFLDIGTDAYNWNVTGSVISGTKVSINTTFATGENDDGFYATGTFPTVVSDSFSLKVRGALIASTSAGKDDEVTTVYNRGQGFANRRMWMMQLDELKASINGVEQQIPGFFMCAAKAGMVAGLNPALPLTNRPVAVFTGVTGTSDRYTNRQLNQMAAGGADIFLQDSDGAPLYSRQQVTTKMTSIAEREQSIVKAVDYCAKFYRNGLRNYIGSFNITQSFLDTLSAVTGGLSDWLVDEGKVVAGAEVLNLLQDEDVPDHVLADISLSVLYPANEIQLTLIV